MTREEAIQYIDGLHCEEDFPYTDTIADFVKERNEAIDMAIEALAVYPQFKWERDTAISQLEEYGIGFAEKKRDLVEVVRCKDCKHCEVLNTKDFYAICNRLDILFEPFEDDTRTHFCAWGERSEE